MTVIAMAVRLLDLGRVLFTFPSQFSTKGAVNQWHHPDSKLNKIWLLPNEVLWLLLLEIFIGAVLFLFSTFASPVGCLSALWLVRPSRCHFLLWFSGTKTVLVLTCWDLLQILVHERSGLRMSSVHCVDPNHVTPFLFHPPKCAACFLSSGPQKEETKEVLFNHVLLHSWEPASLFRDCSQ